MSDHLFQEVDEEVRREQLKKLWERYGSYAIALAVLVVVGVGGWRGYEWWLAKKAAETGAAFEAAVTLSEQGKHAEAEAAFGRIASEGTAGYRLLARFREAAQLAARDPKAAVAAYDALAADARLGRLMQDLAAVRAGYLLVDSAPYAELTQRLEPLTVEGRPYRYAAREILALSAWRAGDQAAARRWSEMVLTDAAAPPTVRARMEMLMTLAGPTGKG